MLAEIIKIALLCIVLGGASIPIAFSISSNPFVVWTGNALGSLASAVVVLYIANHIKNQSFKRRVSQWKIGKKIVFAYDDGSRHKKVGKARVLINKHGLRVFSLFCPIFPGVLISTIAVVVLDMDRKIYTRWMLAGVVLVSGLYVFACWFLLEYL